MNPEMATLQVVAMNQVTNIIDSIDNIFFLNRSAWWLLLFLIPIIFLVYRSHRIGARTSRAFRTDFSTKSYIILGICYVMIFSGIVGILTKPVIKEETAREIVVDGDFIFLMDVSKSTEARADIESKTQMELAKETVGEVIDKLGNSRMQIFAYTVSALPFSDFTQDKEHILYVLEHGVDSGAIFKRGSDLPNALANIVRLKMNDPRYKDLSYIVLVTDGQISPDYAHLFPIALEMLQDNDISIITVGVGSAAGWKIPIFTNSGTFSGKYEQLRIGTNRDFISVLNEHNLKVLADISGGKYFYYEDVEELKKYLENVSEPNQLSVKDIGNKGISGSKDISWAFAVLILIGSLVLVLNRKLI